jgi:hypothetical protein
MYLNILKEAGPLSCAFDEVTVSFSKMHLRIKITGKKDRVSSRIILIFKEICNKQIS